MLFKKLDIEEINHSKLIETIFLKQVNAETVSQAIFGVLMRMKIEQNNVLCLNSDNVPYMARCYSFMKSILPNCMHVTCIAHIISLVGETWRANLPDVKFI